MKPQLPRIAVLSLPALAGGDLLLIPAGTFDAPSGSMTGTGPWTLTESQGLALAARLRELGRDVPIDYEHQTLLAQANGQPAPAAGWVLAAGIEYQPGRGLVGTQVRWTERGAAYLAAGEYRYLSPVFRYAADGSVTDLLHLALTNTPALTPDVLPEVIAAASIRHQGKSMSHVHMLIATMLGLGVAAAPDESALTAALSGLKARLGDADSLPALLDDYEQRIAQLSAQVQAAPPLAALAALQAEVASLKNAALAQARTAQVEAALSDGRLPVGLKDWAMGLGQDALDAYLAVAKPIAALTGTQTGGQAPDQGKPAAKPEELAVCAALGLSLDQFQKYAPAH